VNIDTAAAWATVAVCCGVGGGVQFCVNLRRAAVVDRRAGAEHQHRSDQRIHHRDIAAAIAQQPIKMKCRQRHCPQLTKLATLMRPRATGETSTIKQRASL
jgi:hypothetical protein